jgi:hypothetical protein
MKKSNKTFLSSGNLQYITLLRKLSFETNNTLVSRATEVLHAVREIDFLISCCRRELRATNKDNSRGVNRHFEYNSGTLSLY